MMIDTSDFDLMLSLMDRHEEFDTMLMGSNDLGEFTTTSIYSDKIVMETHQKNGWIRTNVYHRDMTVEELYRKEN